MKKLFASISRTVLNANSAVLLLIICAAWLAITAGVRPLMLPDEGRYVGVAWEMLNSGNWLVPTLDGMPFFHKPPLFYWLTALDLKLFGMNEWAARLASVLSAVLATGVMVAFVRRYVDKPTANLTAIVLVTQPFFFAGAQFADLNMLVAAMISVSIVAGADAALRLERGLPYLASLTTAFVFAALGVLAKGLIGFVLPGAILLAWLLVRRRLKQLPSLLPLNLLLLFFVLVVPWFGWMQHSYDGFWDYFFVYHHFHRFAATGFNNQQVFWFYVPVLILATLPWSPWIYRSCSPSFLKDPERFDIRSLMILWTLGILVFFSVPSSKLVGHILPALPPFAYLIADGLLLWLKASKRPAASAIVGLSIAVAGVTCVVLVLLVTRFDTRSFSAASLPISKIYDVNDQIVMLEEYQYDLPFYLKAKKSPWVIGAWRNSEPPTKDNWRKELYDAGLFDQKGMQENLISPGEFALRLCAPGSGPFWLWGRAGLASRYSFLKDKDVVFSDGKKTMWRLVGGCVADPEAKQEN